MGGDISLKGGVLIIGSLYWDQDEFRMNWRNNDLDMASEKRNIPAPIRYGRVSSSRSCTFTMVFSKACDNDKMMGQAIFIPFRTNPINLEQLGRQAINLKKAEQPKNKIDEHYNWKWGCVGILINPNIQDNPDKNQQADLLISHWKNSYSNFNPNSYRIRDEGDIIDENGVFQFSWPDALNDFDFMIATATIPEFSYPLVSNIADRMNVNGYSEYFKTNLEKGITTFQDEEISSLLIYADR